MIPTCATCRFFIPDFEEVDAKFEHPGGEIEYTIESGTCHFAAPQPVMFCFLPSTESHVKPIYNKKGEFQGSETEEEDPDTTTIWPAVDAEDWCGSYKMIDRKGKGKG